MAYSPIRVSVLRGDQKISFDVYIALGDRYVHYIRKGDSFEGSRLNRLKEKKLKKMYIREEDESAYRDYMSRNIEQAYDKTSSQSIENRTQIVQGLQQSMTEAVLENPEDVKAYESAKEGSERFVRFLMDEDQAIKGMLAIKNTDQNLAHHGVIVSTLAVEIARITGYKDERNLPFLALGALVHDLGHYLSQQNIARPLSEFSPEEMQIYKSHPAAAATKLKDLKHMDQHVTQIVMQHEETINGGGFPDKLTENKLNPLSIFVQSANIFDRMVSFENLTKDEAVKRLFLDEIGKYPLTHLNALKNIASRCRF